MDKAIWKGQEINVVDIVKDPELEEAISEASTKHELKCPDSHCDSRELIYCHGNINSAYFRHKNIGNCDYVNYDKADTEKIRTIRRKLYEHLSSKYNVQSEIKILEHHFTHLLVTNSDGSKLAIELVVEKNEIVNIKNLMHEYEQLGISAQWIVIGKNGWIQNDENLSQLRKFILNNSQRKNIVVIERKKDDFENDDIKVGQYQLDNNNYEYKQFKVLPNNVYSSKTKSINELIIKNNELSIVDFDEKYQKWLNTKKEQFSEFVKLSTEREANQQISQPIKKASTTTELNHQFQKANIPISDYNPYSDYDIKIQNIYNLIESIKRRKEISEDGKILIKNEWVDEKTLFDIFLKATKF